MSAFKGMKNAKRGYASNPFKSEDAEYIVRIDSAKTFNAPNKGEMAKIGATILTVLSGSHREGEQVDVFWDTTNGIPQFQQNLKSFLGPVTGLADEEIDGEKVLELMPEDGGSDLEGQVVRVRVRLQASKKSKDEQGNPRLYRKFSWSEAMDETEILDAIGAERVAKFFPNGL